MNSLKCQCQTPSLVQPCLFPWECALPFTPRGPYFFLAWTSSCAVHDCSHCFQDSSDCSLPQSSHWKKQSDGWISSYPLWPATKHLNWLVFKFKTTNTKWLSSTLQYILQLPFPRKETESHVTHTILWLTAQLWMTSNFWSLCHHPWSASIKFVHHHTKFMYCWRCTQHLVHMRQCPLSAEVHACRPLIAFGKVPPPWNTSFGSWDTVETFAGHLPNPECFCAQDKCVCVYLSPPSLHTSPCTDSYPIYMLTISGCVCLDTKLSHPQISRQ